MPNNSNELLSKLAALTPPAVPLADSDFLPVTGTGAFAERVLTNQGYYVSSPADGWILHAIPF